MKITLDLDVNNLSGKDIRVLKAIIDTSALQEVRISNPAVMAEVLKPDTVVPPTPKVEPLPVKPKAEPVVPPTPPVAAPIEPVVPPAPVAQTPTEAFGTPTIPATPPATVPAAPVAEQPTPDVELDSAGVPWDAEIHSSGKSFVRDGTWKRKRGITDDEYNERVRELLGAKKPEPSDIPAAPAADAPMNWSDLMRLITPKVAGANPEIQMEHINAWLSARGITEGFGVLARRPDLFPEFCEDFKLC